MRRNSGWGELHIYNWETHKPTLTVNPIEKRCCYRDARWSPDGSYLLFAFQDEGLADADSPDAVWISHEEVMAESAARREELQALIKKQKAH